MPKPFLYYELFAPSSDLKPEMLAIPGMGNMVVIDNFYQRPTEILEMLEDAPAPPWKIAFNSKNYKDYYDCRLNLSAHPNLYDPRDLMSQVALCNIAEKMLGVAVSKKRYPYSFNIFQWIDPPSQEYQHYPHRDGHGKDTVGSIIFLNRDAEASGGTAFYRDDPAQLHLQIGRAEHEDIRVDIDRHCELAAIVPARFNRCILFPGWFTHGGYIEDHRTYVGDRWRINQVYFFEANGARATSQGPER